MLAFLPSAFCSNDILPQVEAYLSGVKFIYAKFEQIMSSGDFHFGQFWLGKKNRKTKIRIKYEDDIAQDVFIVDSIVTVFDKKTSKKYVSSLSKTPIYSILTGSLNLSHENYEILENSKNRLRLNLKKSSIFGNMNIVLMFSKYQNGNLKNIEGWIISDGKSETIFSFDQDTLSVNDEKKIPDSIFSFPENN
jgi:outer membrane lipoprotein-sorting protein